MVGLYLVIWGKSKDEKVVQVHETAKPNSLTKAEKADGSETISGHNVV